MAADPDGGTTEKHPRKRVRGLLKTLQDQIEFYFGDANLSKDRFLQQKINDNPEGFVPIEVIAKFNKMKELTSECSLIVQAIRNSSVVELSEDEKSLRRCTPMPEIAQSDIDLRTVYVENLPTTPTDHDHVKKLFGVFGRVVYVSLPRHKVSGKLKGFGFVEFSTQEEAQNALEYFQSGAKPPPTPTTKKTLGSTDITSQSEGEGEVKREAVVKQGAGKVEEGEEVGKGTSRKQKREEEGNEQQDANITSGIHAEGTEEEASEGTSRKRKRKEEESEAAVKQQDANVKEESQDEGVESERKRRRLDEGSSKKEDIQQETSRKRKRTELEGDSEDEISKKSGRLESQSSDIFGGADHKKKKNRQHKKKDKWATLKEYNLKVMAKKEWSEMKQLYRDMQKEQMKQLKAETHKEGTQRTEGKGFVSNCLIRVECEEEGEITVDSLRETCSKYGEVAFVDFTEGEKGGYIRYRTSGCVEKVVESEKIPNVTFHAVGEEDEKIYYLKTQAARKQSWMVKQQGKKKKRNMRGQDKVVSRALQRQGGRKEGGAAPEHIRFSDSDNEVAES